MGIAYTLSTLIVTLFKGWNVILAFPFSCNKDCYEAKITDPREAKFEFQ